jgi:hypothetical protein
MRTGSDEAAWHGETRNLSSCGVLFSIVADIPVDASIEYVITLPGASGPPPRLRCMGKIVRRETSATAATLEHYEFIR